MDMVANTFMRAPGEAVGTFALECAIDELAVEIGMDPIELRLRNEPEKDPTDRAAILPARHRARLGATERSVSAGSRRNATPARAARANGSIGMGCATGTYPYYRMPGGAARLTLTREGRATVAIAAHEMGMGTATAQTQVAAERLGLPMEQVEVLYGDTMFPAWCLPAARSRRPPSARR